MQQSIDSGDALSPLRWAIAGYLLLFRHAVADADAQPDLLMEKRRPWVSELIFSKRGHR